MTAAPPAAATKRIFIVEDHDFLRIGLEQFLELEPDLEICGDRARARGAVPAILAAAPDLVLIDISLPDGSGLELIKDLRAAKFEGGILVLSMHDEGLYAVRALRAGASGYAMKSMSSDQVLEAVREVLRGEIFTTEATGDRLLKNIGRTPAGRARRAMEELTDREMEILELMGNGLTTLQIGARLCVSSKTVDAHRAHIKKKLGIDKMSELIHFAVMRFSANHG